MDEVVTWYSQHVRSSQPKGRSPSTPPWSSSRRSTQLPPCTRIEERISTVEWCQDSEDEDDGGLVFGGNHSDNNSETQVRSPSVDPPYDCSERLDLTRSSPIPAAVVGRLQTSRGDVSSWPPKDGSRLPSAMPSPGQRSGHLLSDGIRISIQDDIILHLQQKLLVQEEQLMEREREVTFLRSLLGSRSSSVEP
jgi:hypothetical protein